MKGFFMKMKCIYIVSKYTKHFMKTFKTNLLGMALAGLILSACSQTGMYETADLMNEQAEASKSGFRLDPFGVGNENAMELTGGSDFNINCITSTSGSVYKASGSLSGKWGGPDGDKFSKTLNVEVWNTPTTIEYRFLMTGDGGNLQYYDEITASWINAGSLTAGTVRSISRPLPTDWVAGQVITEQWRQTGSGGPLGGDGTNIVENGVVSYALIGICTTTSLSEGTTEPICKGAPFSLTATVSTSAETLTGGKIEILNSSNVVVASADVTSTVRTVTYNVPTGTADDYTYSARYVRSEPSFRYQNSASSTSTVQVIECGGCDEAFSYVENANGTITFTYKPAVDMDNAKVVLTFAQSAVVTIPGFSPEGATMQAILDLEACETYTWTATISELRCTGLGQTTVNAWTDMTVNTVSKKNEKTPNIVRACN